jgi:hypothetical protein
MPIIPYTGPLCSGPSPKSPVGTTTINGVAVRKDIGGPGVVGVAGRVNFPETFADYGTPTFNNMEGIGVFGRSETKHGVVGQGREIGVVGHGKTGPGGHFSSNLLEGQRNNPQIHIDAQEMSVPSVVEVQTVSAIRPTAVDKLPKFAQLGDLLLTFSRVAGDAQLALLWICTGVLASGAAVWQQVLLGQTIEGKRV